MWKKIEAGAVAGVVAAFLVDVVALGRAVTTSGGGALSILAVVAEGARTHGPWVGGLIALVYGAVLGALFGWLLRQQRPTELSGLFWGVLYGLIWAIVSSLVVVPLLHGDVPLGASALSLVARTYFGSAVGHVLYGALLGVGFALITNHVIALREEARSHSLPERRAAW